MSSASNLVKVAVVGEGQVQDTAPRVPSRRRRRPGIACGAVVGTLAALLAGACSSKNPDSLIGTNVDENLAVMDANASLNVVAATTNASGSNAPSTSISNQGSDRSQSARPSNEDKKEDTAGADALGADADNASGDEVVGSNEIDNGDEPQNGV